MSSSCSQDLTLSGEVNVSCHYEGIISALSSAACIYLILKRERKLFSSCPVASAGLKTLRCLCLYIQKKKNSNKVKEKL